MLKSEEVFPFCLVGNHRELRFHVAFPALLVLRISAVALCHSCANSKSSFSS